MTAESAAPTTPTPATERTRRSLARRAGWNVVDQVLSAVSNVTLAVLAARTLDADAFGAFSVAFVVFGIAVAVERALVGQPLQILHSETPPDRFPGIAGQGLGLVVCIGVAFAAASAVAGVLLGGTVAVALVAVAVWLPLLLLQDACRMAFFARLRPRTATLLDLVRTVLLWLAFAGLLLTGSASLVTCITAWGASAAASAVLGCALLGARPRLSAAAAWVRGRGRLSGYLLAEYLVGQGAAQLSMLLAGVIAGTRSVGALRAGEVVLGPLGILGSAAFAFAIPELARRSRSARQRRVAGLLASGVMGLAAVVYLVAALLLPDSVGVAVFGDSWAGGRAVLLPMGLATLALALGSGPGIVLYSLGKANVTFRLHAVKAPLLLVSVVVGAHQAGAVGAAIALAACEAVLLPAWFWAAVQHSREEVRTRTSGAA